MDSFETPVGEIIDEDVPQKIKVDNGRHGKIDRHIRYHLYKHLKNVGKEVLSFIGKNRASHLDGVIVGGHKELINKIKLFLPFQLKRKVIGDFVASLDLSVGELTKKAISAANKPSYDS